MKNKILFSIIISTLCLTSNLFGQLDTLKLESTDIEKLLYRPLTEGSNQWVHMIHNDTTYLIKIICYDGIPYRGEVYLATMIEEPVAEVNYWDSTYLFANNETHRAGEKMSLLRLPILTDSSVSFRYTKPVNMYIVNAFTGDTVVTHNFPQPSVNVVTAKRTNWTMAERKKIEAALGIDASLDRVTVEVPVETLSYGYSLQQGLYFAYFINTVDGKLCWAEKIVKP